MIFWLYRLKKKISRAIAANREPKLLARGVASGFLLGVTPPGNLTSLSIAVLIFCLRLNHSLAAITAIATALVAPLLDPMSHWIGSQILSDPPLFHLFQKAWNQPLFAWTDLNNSVILGSFAIGICVYYPILRSTEHFFKKVIKVNALEAENGENRFDASNKTKSSQEAIQSQIVVVRGTQTADSITESLDTQIDTRDRETPQTDNMQSRSNELDLDSESVQLQMLIRRLREEPRRRAS